MSNPIDDIRESTKTFVDDRLKNPYLTAVFAVWIFSNRVLVYGIFNFSDNKNFEEKLSWISSQLRGFENYGFTGLWGGILWAAIWGIVSMIAFNLITGGGKALYKKINKSSIIMLQWVSPGNWISIKDFDEILEKNETLSKKYNDLKKELNILEEEAKKHAKNTIEIEEFNISNREKEDIIKNLKDEVTDLQKRVKIDESPILEIAKGKNSLKRGSKLMELTYDAEEQNSLIREYKKLKENTYLFNYFQTLLLIISDNPNKIDFESSELQELLLRANGDDTHGQYIIEQLSKMAVLSYDNIYNVYSINKKCRYFIQLFINSNHDDTYKSINIDNLKTIID